MTRGIWVCLAVALLAPPLLAVADPAPVAVAVSGSPLRAERANAWVTRVPVADDGAAREQPRPLAQEEVLWAFDFHTQAYYRLPVRLVHRTPTVRVYLEVALPVEEAVARAIGDLFDTTVHPGVRAAFGPEVSPGIDDEAAISLVLLDIRDPLFHGLSPHTYFSGYFDPVNQRRQVDLDREGTAARSNEREMIYVDVAGGDPLGEVVRQTVAHEFAHLVQWSHDPVDDAWLNEGLSELAVWLCGLGHPREHVAHFLADPAVALTSWNGEPRDFGKAYLFLLYLAERASAIDAGWLRALVADPADGLPSLRNTLPLDGSLADVFHEYALALYLDTYELPDPRLGFRSLALGVGAGPASYPRPATRPRSLAGRERAHLEIGPWTLRADEVLVGPHAVEVEVQALDHLCVGAFRGTVHAAGEVRSACLAPGQAVAWPFPAPAPPADGEAVILVSANGGDLPNEVAIGLLVGPAAFGRPGTALFPLALGAR